MHQPIRVMNALGVARDLGADHAGGIALQLGATHATDGRTTDHFDIQRARRRAIVRARGMLNLDFCLLVHAPIATIKTGTAERIYWPYAMRRGTPRRWRGSIGH